MLSWLSSVPLRDSNPACMPSRLGGSVLVLLVLGGVGLRPLARLDHVGLVVTEVDAVGDGVARLENVGRIERELSDMDRFVGLVQHLVEPRLRLELFAVLVVHDGSLRLWLLIPADTLMPVLSSVPAGDSSPSVYRSGWADQRSSPSEISNIRPSGVSANVRPRGPK